MTILARSATIKLHQSVQLVPLVPLSAHTELPDGKKVSLVFSGMRAAVQPGVTYRVYLGSGSNIPQDESHYVGSINFFSAVPIPGAKNIPRTVYTLDKTLAASILGEGQWNVLVVPEGEPHPQAKTEIERIDLIVQ